MLCAVVLGAGASRRHPQGKLLTDYRGKPLVMWTLENLRSLEVVDKLVLVTGFRADEMESLGVETVFNPDWREGISSSIRAGVGAVPKGHDLLLTLGDTPFFAKQSVSLLLAARARIRVPSYLGVWGHPKYFPRRFLPVLGSLSGDRGAKTLLSQYQDELDALEVEDPGILLDFDRPQDFNRPPPSGWPL